MVWSDGLYLLRFCILRLGYKIIIFSNFWVLRRLTPPTSTASISAIKCRNHLRFFWRNRIGPYLKVWASIGVLELACGERKRKHSLIPPQDSISITMFILLSHCNGFESSLGRPMLQESFLELDSGLAIKPFEIIGFKTLRNLQIGFET